MRIGFDGKTPCAHEGVKNAGVARTPALAAMMRRRVGFNITSPVAHETLPAFVFHLTLGHLE